MSRCLFAVAVVYLTCTMAITTLAMLATVLVLNFYEIRDRPVPGWIHRLMTTIMVDPSHRSSSRRLLVPGSLNPGHNQTESDSLYHLMRLIDPENLVPEVGLYDEDDVIRAIHVTAAAPPEVVQRLVPTPQSRDFATINYRSVGAHSYHGNGGRRENFSDEWLHLAIVCDRLFFWACLLMTVVSTLVLFHPLLKYELFQNVTRPTSGQI